MIHVVEQAGGGVELFFDDPAGRFAFVFELSVDEAIDLGRVLLDGAPPEGATGAAELTSPRHPSAGVGGAERGPERLTRALERLVAGLTQQHHTSRGRT